MVYITKKASPRYRQMSLEDLLFGNFDDDFHTLISKNETGTVTRVYDTTPKWALEFADRSGEVWALRERLAVFAHGTAKLRAVPRRSLYREFYIPKSSGGLRRIDGPVAELKNAQYELQRILEGFPTETYHTSAYGYVKGRCNKDALIRHQQNESKWFAKFDLKDFFGSTTKDFLLSQIAKIYPYNLIVLSPGGAEIMSDALELCFLDGGLPQGSPISPFLTNLMMIPFDYTISNALRDFETPTGKQTLIYTRYVDDFIISSRYGFSFRDVEKQIEGTFAYMKAPFRLKKEKTRYGSASGRNWNLGLMLNKDNEITVGHAKKKNLQNMLFAYAKDRSSGIRWAEHDIRVLAGQISYCKMIEGETIDRIVSHVGGKLGVDIPSAIKADLKT